MFYYMQKENVYKQEAENDQKTIMVDAILLSIIVTLIGLGFSVYNYIIFDKPFITTKGLLAAFYLGATVVAISLSKSNRR